MIIETHPTVAACPSCINSLDDGAGVFLWQDATRGGARLVCEHVRREERQHAQQRIDVDAEDAAMMDDRSPVLEAYGVKGPKSRPWSRTFRNADHLNAWAEKNDAEVHGTREVD